MSDIDNLLIKLSIYPNKIGYDYIKYILQTYEIKSIRTELATCIIPAVAKKFDSSIWNVDRAIRYAKSSEEFKERLSKLLNLPNEFRIRNIKNAEFLCLLKQVLEGKSE